jgi:hypothetical protein
VGPGVRCWGSRHPKARLRGESELKEGDHFDAFEQPLFTQELPCVSAGCAEYSQEEILANCDLTTARKGKTMKHMAGDTLRFAVGNLDHIDFWPIFEMASHLRIPLFIHPQTRPRAVWEAYYSGFDNPGRSSVCHVRSRMALRLWNFSSFDLSLRPGTSHINHKFGAQSRRDVSASHEWSNTQEMDISELRGAAAAAAVQLGNAGDHVE